MKRKLVKLKRRSKYGSQRTAHKDVTYASVLEADTAAWLDLMVKAGEVKKWEGQPKFDLLAAHNRDPLHWFAIKIGTYTADFRVTFADDHEEIWECKSPVVRSKKTGRKNYLTRTPLYRFKLKIFKANYPNLIHREITREDLPRILR